MAGSCGQNSPSRIGLFTWHGDMRKLDARVANATDRVSTLESTSLRPDDFASLKHKLEMLETRLQHACEIMDSHSAYIATQESRCEHESTHEGEEESLMIDGTLHASSVPPSSPRMPKQDENFEICTPKTRMPKSVTNC